VVIICGDNLSGSSHLRYDSVQKVNYTDDNVILSQLDLIAPSTELLYSSQILTQDNIVRPIFVPCETLNTPSPQPRFVIRAMLRVKKDYFPNQPYPFYLCNKKVMFSGFFFFYVNPWNINYEYYTPPGARVDE
jgi:hypothetical protein